MLCRGINCQSRIVVVGDGDVRFHRIGIGHGEKELSLDRVSGAGKRGTGIAPLQMDLLADIARLRAGRIIETTKSSRAIGHFVNQRRTAGERRVHVEHGGQLFIVHSNRLERVVGAALILRNNCGHRLSQKADLSDRQ